MVKKWFCAILAVLTVNLTFSRCTSTSRVEVNMLGYMPENVGLIEKDIKEKNLKTPITVKNKEIVLHITQGPIAGALLSSQEFASTIYKGVDLGSGNEDQQEKILNNQGNHRLIVKDYSKSMAVVLEKQLGRYFSKVRVINNDVTAAPGVISLKSFFEMKMTPSIKKSTVTITAVLPGGAPITATGTHEIRHFHPGSLIPIAILFMPIGTIIVFSVLNSLHNRTRAAATWLAMNSACENLAQQLSRRIAEIEGDIIEIQVAITGLQTE